MATLAANMNQTRLLGDIQTAGRLKGDSLNTNTLFSTEEKAKLEQGQPTGKMVLLLHYKTNKLAYLLRNTGFGKTAIVFDNRDKRRDESFSAKVLTDITVQYSSVPWFRVTAGSNNVFDIYPDCNSDYRNTMEEQHIYPLEVSPFGFIGGY